MKAPLVFKEFVNKCIKPFLTKLGFIAKGNTFHLLITENLCLVNLQKSSMSTKEKVKFTVNLGIASSTLLHFDFKEIKGVTISDCHWNQRIGFLLPKHDDIWWALTPSTDINQLCEEFKEYLLSFAIPELKKYASDDSLINLWISGSGPGLTELQRLKYLSVLLKKIGPAKMLPTVIEKLRTIASTMPNSSTIKLHLKKLEEFD